MEVEELPTPPTYMLWAVGTAVFFSLIFKKDVTYREIAVRSYEFNAMAHVVLVLYMASIGKGEVSLFESTERQVVNLGAIPVTVILLVWIRWCRRYPVGAARSFMFNLPVVFIVLGYLTVWPEFFRTQQHDWPCLYTLLWIFIFWCEHTSALAVVCLRNKTLLTNNN